MKYIDYTMISAFLKCPYYYYFRHILHLVPLVKPTYFSFGSAWHAALEVLHRDGTLAEAKEKFAEEHQDSPEDTMRTVARGQKMLELYTKKYAHDPYEVIYAETPFHIAMGNFILCGKADAITRHKVDSHVYLKESKTATRTGASYYRKFDFNYQVDIYTMGVLELIGDCVGALIDIAKVTKSTPTLDHFERYPTSRSYTTLEVSKRHIINVVKNIEALENYFKVRDGKGVPWNAPDWSLPYFNKEHCYDYSGCTYFDICRTDVDKRALKMFKKVVWNPEKGEEEEIVG